MNHGTPAGAHRATGRPIPRANAADAQDPEPPPHQHRDATGVGDTTPGHGPRGSTTSTPPGRRERTSAAERRANAPRPEPHRPEETANTVARGNAPRTTASTPEAHPTETGTPGGTAAHATSAAEQSGPPETREPENPTTDAPRRNPARSPPTARLPHRDRSERPSEHREHPPRGRRSQQSRGKKRVVPRHSGIPRVLRPRRQPPPEGTPRQRRRRGERSPRERGRPNERRRHDRSDPRTKERPEHPPPGGDPGAPSRRTSGEHLRHQITSHRDDADAHRRDRNTETADDQTDIPPTPKRKIECAARCALIGAPSGAQRSDKGAGSRPRSAAKRREAGGGAGFSACRFPGGGGPAAP